MAATTIWFVGSSSTEKISTVPVTTEEAERLLTSSCIFGDAYPDSGEEIALSTEGAPADVVANLDLLLSLSFSGENGRLKMKVLPLPNLLLTDSVPPMAAASSLAMESPNPVPPNARSA